MIALQLLAGAVAVSLLFGTLAIRAKAL